MYWSFGALGSTSRSPSIPDGFWDAAWSLVWCIHLSCLCWCMEPGWGGHGARAALRTWGAQFRAAFAEGSWAFIANICRYPKILLPKAASQVWALKVGLQKHWAPRTAGSWLGTEGKDLSNTGGKNNFFFLFIFLIDFLVHPPASEVLFHPQGPVLLLLLMTLVFLEAATLFALGNAAGCFCPCDGSNAVTAGWPCAFQWK